MNLLKGCFGSRKAQIVKQGILGILWVVFIVLILEGGLRLYGVNPSTDRMVVYQFDDTVGWKPRADFKYFRSTPYYGNFNYYNSDGFPTDSGHWHQKASTTQSSVAILGSSFAESYYVPYEQSFPYQIEKSLKGKQVLNFGVSGYAPDQALLRSRAEFPKYTISDIVFIFFPYKDLQGIITDNTNGSEKPIFGDSLERPINTPLLKPDPEKIQTGLVSRVRQTALYTLLRPYVRKNIGGSLMADGTSAAYDPVLMEKVMTYFEAIKKENPSARLVIYEIPFYKEMNDLELFQKNTSVYMDACLNRQFTCMSMGEIISKHPNVSDLFIVGDGHVTAYGAKLVADQIVSKLKTASSTEK